MPVSEEIKEFIIESNAIEGITRAPTEGELDKLHNFLDLGFLTVDDIVDFVSVYEPKAVLRLNGEVVSVGDHVPPVGGQNILYRLNEILLGVNSNLSDPFYAHVLYERLHPFTDCNGRSGRAIWYWMMARGGDDLQGGFLHKFYYQALEGSL